MALLIYISLNSYTIDLDSVTGDCKSELSMIHNQTTGKSQPGVDASLLVIAVLHWTNPHAHTRLMRA